MFDWPGLPKAHQYYLLKQTSDPLKYCNYSIPIPLGIGLPFMPCDLPNQYTLHKSDESFQHEGDIYLTFEEEVNLLHRVLIPASHRPWTIKGKDYYQHIPYIAVRDFNICLQSTDRPQIRMFFKDRYIGKIIEKTILNCCCVTDVFQQFEIYDQNEELLYRVVSRNPQRGHFGMFPCWGFDRIVYDVMRVEDLVLSQEGVGEEEKGVRYREGDIANRRNEKGEQMQAKLQKQQLEPTINEGQSLGQNTEQSKQRHRFERPKQQLKQEDQLSSDDQNNHKSPDQREMIRLNSSDLSEHNHDRLQSRSDKQSKQKPRIFTDSFRKSHKKDGTVQRQSNVYNLTEGEKVGEIVHIWNGCAEYTSKNDKYGIEFPEEISEEHKCMLIYCTLFIDYLLFQNF